MNTPITAEKPTMVRIIALDCAARAAAVKIPAKPTRPISRPTSKAVSAPTAPTSVAVLMPEYSAKTIPSRSRITGQAAPIAPQR
jgi:hypothetical protein